MRTIQAIVLALALAFVMAPAASAQGEGYVDWAQNVVTFVGYGTATPSGNMAKDKIKAIRTAKLLASRGLLETINGVHIDARSLVVDSVLKKEVLASRVDGMIRAARVLRTDVSREDDGSVMAEVELAVCLTGRGQCAGMPNLAETIDIEAAKASESVPQEEYEAIPEALASLFGEEVAPAPTEQASDGELKLASIMPEPIQPPAPSAPAFDAAKPATGLVIQVGQRFDPAMLPVIAVKDDSGKLKALYSIKVIAPEVFRDKGMAVYPSSVSEAYRLGDLGDNVIYANGRYGNQPGLILLSKKDAWLIAEQARRGSEYLKNGNVAICGQ